MRIRNVLTVLALVALLVVSTAVVAVADGGRGDHGSHGRTGSTYRISKPRVVSEHVVAGAAFDASGLVAPILAVDDPSLSVVVEVYAKSKGHRALVNTFVAVTTPAEATKTAYAASVTIVEKGQYELVAKVLQGTTVLSRSSARPVVVALPFRMSKPKLAAGAVAPGASFDASVVVSPGLADDDTAATTFFIYKLGRHHSRTLVGEFVAVRVGAVENGTAFSATLSVADAGTYAIAARLVRDTTVLGQSKDRELRVRVPEPVEED